MDLPDTARQQHDTLHPHARQPEQQRSYRCSSSWPRLWTVFDNSQCSEATSPYPTGRDRASCPINIEAPVRPRNGMAGDVIDRTPVVGRWSGEPVEQEAERGEACEAHR
jgi:hypothetical protein